MLGLLMIFGALCVVGVVGALIGALVMWAFGLTGKAVIIGAAAAIIFAVLFYIWLAKAGGGFGPQ